MLLKPCPCCERLVYFADVQRRTRNTCYVEEYDELNYLLSCSECHAADCEHFEELWADIRAGW